MNKFDYIVIGGGSIGMATAFKLKKAFPKVTIGVIDNDYKGSASRAAGAMLGCFAEVTKYTFTHPASAAKFKMMYSAHKVWKEWMSEIEKAAKRKIIHFPGTYIILNTQGGNLDDANFQSVIDTLDSYKEPYDVVDPRNIEDLEPSALERPLRAIFLPNEGSLNSHQYLEVLKEACVRQGIVFFSGEVSTITKEEQSYSVSTNQDKFSCTNIILAAGSNTSRLIKQTKLNISIMPVLSGAGVSVVTKRMVGKPFKHTIRTSNRAGSCGLHLVPMEDNKEYLGATNVIYTEPQFESSLGMSHFLTQCAIEQITKKLYFSNTEAWRVGNRPVALDTLPLIGKTSQENIYLVSGTYRDGFHCSPIIAESLVNEMSGEKPIVPSEFIPERKPIEIITKEESVHEHAMQAVSGAYENWLRLPYYMDDTQIYNDAKKKANDIYTQLNTDFGLHPDILLYLSSTSSEDVEIIKQYLAHI